MCRRGDVEEGAVREFTVMGHLIYVANLGGEYFAGEASCPHAGCSLGEGALQGSFLTCVCHGAQFEVRDGRVMRPPARRPVTTYATELRGDDVYVDV